MWENKLVFDDGTPARAQVKQQQDDSPLKIGWIGTIRCAPSLEILAQLARARPNDVEIHIHGIVHAHALPDFETILQNTPNMHYHGPYEYPAALSSIYGSIDLVWSQDLWQSGGNSDWLLPNRIYEASWCGCPSLAVAGTETGHKIEADALGWVIPTPSSEALLNLLSGLSRAEIHDRHIDLLQRPDSDFVFHGDDLKAPIMKLVRSADGG